MRALSDVSHIAHAKRGGIYVYLLLKRWRVAGERGFAPQSRDAGCVRSLQPPSCVQVPPVSLHKEGSGRHAACTNYSPCLIQSAGLSSQRLATLGFLAGSIICGPIADPRAPEMASDAGVVRAGRLLTPKRCRGVSCDSRGSPVLRSPLAASPMWGVRGQQRCRCRA